MLNDKLQHHGVLGMKWGVRRYQNKDGTLTKAGKKLDKKEADKQVKKRSADLRIKSNNYAAERINGKWIKDFNKKWSKEFEGYEDWSESPKFNEYVKSYSKNLTKLSNEYLKTTTKSEFTTKLGQTYTARFLEEHGQQIMWATPEEWVAYETKNNTQ